MGDVNKSFHITSKNLAWLRNSRFVAVAGFLFIITSFSFNAFAKKPDILERQKGESIFGDSQSLSRSHFTWGADFGASIDMQGTDLSTFDVEAMLGYKNKFINFAGVGAGIHRAIGVGSNLIPVYGMIRTSFTSKPSLLFLDLKAGYSFNSIGQSSGKGAAIFSTGIGVNLATSRRFSSHLILSYSFYSVHKDQRVGDLEGIKGINYACIRFGVNF